jgi:uncharacterized protein involved in type VI secretion and phage assembly
MSRIPGVVTGVVKSVEDPDQQGRVQISLPYLGGQNDSTMAPVATLMSGGGRGSWFMPEVGDEVLVAFNQEDVQHPFIIGFLWNGKDKPPSKDISTKVRRLRTVSGHQIDFDDRGGEEKITITTHGGHKILMDDTPGSQGVSIKTSGGQEVTLKDQPASITIQTTMQNQIVVSDAPPGITISAPNGILNVSCMMASVSADAVLNISAPMTIFDGVVQAQTVIATAVVGSAYTPAPGNTFGL